MVKKNPAIISILLFFMAAHLNAALPPIYLTLKNGECPTIQLKIVPKNMGSSKTKKGHSYFELELSSRHVGRVNGKIKEVCLVDINMQGTNFEFKKKSKTLSSSTLIIANNSIKGTRLVITYHSKAEALRIFFRRLGGGGVVGPTAFTTYIIPLDTLSGMAPKPRKNQAVGVDEESQKGE